MTNINDYIASVAVHRYGALQKPTELKWLLDKLEPVDPHLIVEIGCDAGGTLYLWNRIAPIVLGIDLPGGPFGTGRPLTPHGATLILGDSHDFRTFKAAEGFTNSGADMLFIDGDHTYDGVILDFFTYACLVRENGAVVLQDIRDHHQEDVGVHRLWEAIKKAWPDRCEEFMDGPDDWGGIGILWNFDWSQEIEVADPAIRDAIMNTRKHHLA